MTCNDCIHCSACHEMYLIAVSFEDDFFEVNDAETCEDFKNEADYAEVRHGKWKMNFGRGYGEKLYFCSLCIEGDSDTGHDNYCPNCGAKMDG